MLKRRFMNGPMASLRFLRARTEGFFSSLLVPDPAFQRSRRPDFDAFSCVYSQPFPFRHQPEGSLAEAQFGRNVEQLPDEPGPQADFPIAGTEHDPKLPYKAAGQSPASVDGCVGHYVVPGLRDTAAYSFEG